MIPRFFCRFLNGLFRDFRICGRDRLFRVFRICGRDRLFRVFRICGCDRLFRDFRICGRDRLFRSLLRIRLVDRILVLRFYFNALIDACLRTVFGGSGLDRNHIFRGCVDVHIILGKRCDGQQLQHHDDRNKDRQGTSAEKDSGQL